MINRDEEATGKFFPQNSEWGVQSQNKNFSVLAISKLSKPTKPTGGNSVLNVSIKKVQNSKHYLTVSRESKNDKTILRRNFFTLYRENYKVDRC
jgi:hypothetical protein